MNRTRKILNIQGLATKVGKLRRDLVAASPSAKIIIQIQINALTSQMSMESRGLRQEEWKVC